MNLELIKYTNYYKKPMLWTVYNDFGGAPYIFHREYENRKRSYLGISLIHADESNLWFPDDIAKILNEWAWEFETASNLNMDQYIKTGLYMSSIIACYVAKHNIFLRYDTGNTESNIDKIYHIDPETAENGLSLNIYPDLNEYYKLDNLRKLWRQCE